MGIFVCASDAHGCACSTSEALPIRLRPPSAAIPSPVPVRRRRRSWHCRTGCPFVCEIPLTVTSTTVTRGRFGSLDPRLPPEACRRASRTHRTPSPHHCLLVRFDQLIVVDDSFKQLNPLALSGETTTPIRIGVCHMLSTAIGGHAVFARTASHSGPCAVLSPDNDVAHRTK